MRQVMKTSRFDISLAVSVGRPADWRQNRRRNRLSLVQGSGIARNTRLTDKENLTLRAMPVFLILSKAELAAIAVSAVSPLRHPTNMKQIKEFSGNALLIFPKASTHGIGLIPLTLSKPSPTSLLNRLNLAISNRLKQRLVIPLVLLCVGKRKLCHRESEAELEPI